jgi:telomere length regulation protein
LLLTLSRYIRDLITGLRDAENYDRFKLAITNAANLIRRKANFGKEVSDHAEELGSLLLGLNNPFEIEEFEELRQQALIALLIAQPAEVARLIARNFFDGDFSLQQRTAMLTTLGLGARELAGFKDEDQTVTPSFPSKRLPPHLDKIYRSANAQSIDNVSAKLERKIIEPMALEAADKASGPNALKVRTFSSRMAAEKARSKPITNQLAKTVAENFFFPLTGRWWTYRQAYRSQSSFFSTHLLPIYIRTLALLLHASGPSTVSLPQMTSELWDLLLSVRSNALTNNIIGVIEAILFAFMILLDVNEDKQRLATEHAKELVETQEWAKLVLEKMQTGGDEGERVRMLAAGVVVRCHEVSEKWQRLLFGDMIDT